MVNYLSMLDINTCFFRGRMCPISTVRRIGMVGKWPANLSQIASLDPQELHLVGISLLLIEDSRLVITLPVVPIIQVVLYVLVQ